MKGWQLPKEAVIDGKTYRLHTDYRDILQIFGWLQDETQPEFLRWYVALALFYEPRIPDEAFQQAAEYLRWFVCCGQPEEQDPGPGLIDWQQDAQVIAADINRAAGREIREMPYLHWWTFLSWFHSIGEGGLCTLVSIRDKLRRGKKLEPWEQTYYHRNRNLVKMRKKSSAEELAERERLEKLLAKGQ